MPKRKTFPVNKLIENVNERNRLSICSAEVRNGWNSVLTDILMATDNYEGFRYLQSNEVPHGELPGIYDTAIGAESENWLAPVTITKSFPDYSRIEFITNDPQEAHKIFKFGSD